MRLSLKAQMFLTIAIAVAAIGVVSASVTSVTLNSPGSNFWTNDTTPDFNFTVTGTSAAYSCTLYIDGPTAYGTNASTLNNTPTVITASSALSPAGHGWQVGCDDGGTPAFSESRTIYVDNIAPSANITNPSNSTFTNSTPLIVFVLSDNLADAINYTLYLDGASNQTGIASNGVPKNITLTLAPGPHNVIIEATDIVGYKTNSTAVYFTVDATKPTITLNSPGNDTNSTSAAFVANFTAFDDYSTNMTCMLAGIGGTNSTTVQNGTPALLALTAPGPSSYSWNITCYDQVGNTNTSEMRVWNFDDLPVAVASVFVNETDNFYSNASGNNVLTLIVNASDTVAGIKYITADFSALNQPGITLVNMTNYAGTLWNATITITNVTGMNFVPYNITLTASDNFNNTGILGQNFSVVVLYNMTVPPEQDPCMEWDSITTDFGTVANFGAVNFIIAPKINLSCQTGSSPPSAPPWFNSYERMALINLTSVDMSNPQSGQKLSGLATAMSVTITPPGQFGDSRIYINTTYFSELNTNATVKLYHLPFSSRPAIVADANASGYNSSSVIWEQGVGEGNLTFSVYGFSGYNVTDNTPPIIAVYAPADGSNVPFSPAVFNITLNGTKTQISRATFVVSGPNSSAYYYNTTNGTVVNNTANCTNVTQGSEMFNCIFSAALSNGSYTLSIIAYDYGGLSGNSVSSSTAFYVGPPYVSITAPSNASWHRTNFNLTATAYGSSVRYRVENATGVVVAYTDMASAGGSLYYSTINISALDDGNYTLRINASDSYGNSNASEARLVYIDDTPPSITSCSVSPTTTYVGYAMTGSCAATDNSQSFGGSVSCSVSGIDTSTAGTKTATCTATDSAGNVATLTTNYTVTTRQTDNQGSSGGGLPQEATNTFISVAANSTMTMPVAVANLSVSEVAITVINAIASTTINVKPTTLPSGAPSISAPANRTGGMVHSYFNITATNLAPSNIKSAKIRFKVEKSWLANYSYSAGDVTLFRLVGTAWEQLATRNTSADSSYVYFEADTPGFSTFAIYASKPTTQSAQTICNVSDRKCENSKIWECASDGKSWQVVEVCSYGCNETSKQCNAAAGVQQQPSQNSTGYATEAEPGTPQDYTTAIIILVVVAVAAVGVFVYFKFFHKRIHKHKTVHKEPIQFRVKTEI